MSSVLKRALEIFNGPNPVVHLYARRYRVPSETKGGVTYEVDLQVPECDHPHWADRKVICKHIEAARMEEAIRLKRGELQSIPNPYRNAPYYDAVCGIEEEAVYEMLRCLGAQHPYVLKDFYAKKGRANRHRPPICYGDLLVLGGIAALGDRPSRKSRFKVQDYLQRPKMKASTQRNRQRSSHLTKVLESVIMQTANCVRASARRFAMDSFWLKTPNSEIKRKGKTHVLYSRSAKINWAVDIDTLVCVAFDVADEDENDQKLFDLTWKQLKRFIVEVFFADKGYDDADHYEEVANAGGQAYILRRDYENAKPQAGKPHFNKMLAMMQTAYWEQFQPVYSYRQLVECAIHSLKTVKRVLRGRLAESLRNEIMLLILVHNLRMLLFARYEHGIEIPFADERAMAVIDSAMPLYKKRQERAAERAKATKAAAPKTATRKAARKKKVVRQRKKAA